MSFLTVCSVTSMSTVSSFGFKETILRNKTSRVTLTGVSRITGKLLSFP